MVSVFPKDHCPLGRLLPPPWFSSQTTTKFFFFDFCLPGAQDQYQPPKLASAPGSSEEKMQKNSVTFYICPVVMILPELISFYSNFLSLPLQSSKVALGAFSPVCTAPTRSSQFQILQEQRQPCFDQNLSSLVDSDTRSLLNRRL